MAMGCACLKCCKASGIIRDNDDDDDEKQGEDGSRKLKRDTIIPLDTKHPQSHNKRSGLNFWYGLSHNNIIWHKNSY